MATSGAVIGRGIAVFNAATGAGGTLTGANNGLSLSGTTVQLGGTLINSPTIATGPFALKISGNAGGPGATNIATLGGGYYSFLASSNALPALQTGIYWGVGGTVGIEVQDDNSNTGLIATALYPNSDPKQYAQYGNLPGIVGTVNQRLITGAGTTNYTLYTVNATKNQLLEIDVAVFQNSIAGTVTINLIYTDEGSTVRTVQLASIATLTTVTIPAQIIYAQKNTNVILQVIQSLAGASINIYGSASYLQVSN